jgi:hypothetical protein
MKDKTLFTTSAMLSRSHMKILQVPGLTGVQMHPSASSQASPRACLETQARKSVVILGFSLLSLPFTQVMDR